MNSDTFLATVLRNPVNELIADELFRLALPDAWLVAGCLVQTVWNVLTGRPIDHGIADYDVFYFDSDTSWEAEDAVIRKLHAQLGRHGDLGLLAEARPGEPEPPEHRDATRRRGSRDVRRSAARQSTAICIAGRTAPATS